MEIVGQPKPTEFAKGERYLLEIKANNNQSVIVELTIEEVSEKAVKFKDQNSATFWKLKNKLDGVFEKILN